VNKDVYIKAIVVADSYVNDDVVMLNGEASRTFQLTAPRRTVRGRHCKCFRARKLTSCLDPSALEVSYVHAA